MKARSDDITVIDGNASMAAPMDLQEARAAALRTFARTPLAIDDKAVPAMIELAARQLASGAASENQAALAARPRPANATADDSTVAVIPLHGTVTPRGSLFSMLFGLGGGLQGFRASFREALADDNVSAILIDIDSPGGLIDLVPETAAEIRTARGQGKPIVAIANTLAASAAYWIAAQADEIVVTPSGMVGSVGVFTVHEDLSRMADMMGIKVTMIAAGDHKTDGNPYEPLSKSARAALQDQVDQIYGMFAADVAAGRGVTVQAVTAGYGQGSCLLADNALQLKMVDRIESFEQTLARLGGVAEQETGSEDIDEDDDTELTAVADATAAVNAAVEDGNETTADLASEMDATVPSEAPKDSPKDPSHNYLSGERWRLGGQPKSRSGLGPRRAEHPSGDTPDYLNGEASTQPAWAL